MDNKDRPLTSDVFNKVFNQYLSTPPNRQGKSVEDMKKKIGIGKPTQENSMKNTRMQQNASRTYANVPNSHRNDQKDDSVIVIEQQKSTSPARQLIYDKPMTSANPYFPSAHLQKPTQPEKTLPRTPQSLFSTTINKIVSETSSSAQQSQKIVAEVFTTHGYGLDKIRETTGVKMHLYQYNNLIRQVLRKTFFALTKLVRQYCLYPGSLIGWKEGDQLQLRYASQWMTEQSYETFKKLIRVVEQIDYQQLAKDDVEELYLVIRRKLRVQEDKLVDDSEEEAEKKKKQEFVENRPKKYQRKQKLPPNFQTKKIISPRSQAQNQRQQAMKAVNDIQLEIAELYVAYKTDNEVQEVLTDRHPDQDWLKVFVSLIVNNYTRQGLIKIMGGQEQWAEEHENFPVLKIKNEEEIQQFVNKLIDEKIRASLVQAHLWKKMYPMLAAEVIQSINKYIDDNQKN